MPEQPAPEQLTPEQPPRQPTREQNVPEQPRPEQVRPEQASPATWPGVLARKLEVFQNAQKRESDWWDTVGTSLWNGKQRRAAQQDAAEDLQAFEELLSKANRLGNEVTELRQRTDTNRRRRKITSLTATLQKTEDKLQEMELELLARVGRRQYF